MKMVEFRALVPVEKVGYLMLLLEGQQGDVQVLPVTEKARDPARIATPAEGVEKRTKSRISLAQVRKRLGTTKPIRELCREWLSNGEVSGTDLAERGAEVGYSRTAIYNALTWLVEGGEAVKRQMGGRHKAAIYQLAPK